MKTFLALAFLLTASQLFAQRNEPLALKAAVKVFAQVGGGSSHGVDLSWTKSPTTSVTGYNVWRSTVSGICAFPAGTATSQPAPNGCTKLGNVSTLNFSDASTAVQTEGANFRYVVTAVGPGGESAGSPEASATIPFSIPAAVPSAPTAVSH